MKTPKWLNKAVLATIGALFVGAGIVMALFTPKAHAADGEKWSTWDTAPYAASRKEALGKREDAFRAISLPIPVITQFLRATEKPGKKVSIVAGDHFEAVVVRGAVYHDVLVTADNVSTPAEKWEVRWEDHVFSVFLVFPGENHFSWGFKISTAEKHVVMACPASAGRIQPIVARAT